MSGFTRRPRAMYIGGRPGRRRLLVTLAQVAAAGVLGLLGVYLLPETVPPLAIGVGAAFVVMVVSWPIRR